jgi:hypothetical protein
MAMLGGFVYLIASMWHGPVAVGMILLARLLGGMGSGMYTLCTFIDNEYSHLLKGDFSRSVS